MRTKRSLQEIAKIHALKPGQAMVGDANKVVAKVRKGDLVFIDPPYSGVHYSRFYHVLETVAHGQCGPVSGIGRYPDSARRPRSKYSVKSESTAAFTELLRSISTKRANAVVTFPAHECSNGMSGSEAKRIARKFFTVNTKTVDSKFSTLGGTQEAEQLGNGRTARRVAKEMILVLRPKPKLATSKRRRDKRDR